MNGRPTPDYAPRWTPTNVFLPRVSPKERLTCVICFFPFMRHEGALGLVEHRGREHEALICWGCGGYDQNRKLSLRNVVDAVTRHSPLGELEDAP